MSWDYAEMSSAAKAVGGPEKYAKTLIQYGFQEGVQYSSRLIGHSYNDGIITGIIIMIPSVVALASPYVIPQVNKAISKIKKFFAAKNDEALITAEEAHFAKEALVQGIEEYDREHEEQITSAEISDEKDDSDIYSTNDK